MIKKTRLSFSELSRDEKNPAPKAEARGERETMQYPKAPERKKVTKTYQYSKFGKGRGRGGKSIALRNSGEKIPPLQPGNIRIVPLGVVEEVGKNMTAVEIGEDIIVID